MAQTILVPTDFRVASLNTLKLALESYGDTRVKVMLMYSEALDDSITELLFYDPDKIIKSLTSNEFKEALEVIKNRFEATLWGDINILLFHGNTSTAFYHFAKGNGIDRVFIPKSYQLAPSKKAFDPTALIRRSDIPFIEVGWKIDRSTTEYEQLITLFT